MANKNIDAGRLREFFERGVEEIIQKDSVASKISSGKKLGIKHGVDPTTPDLHLGYSVNYLKLRELQDMGHKIIFLIGDFTARFGDPTQKLESRVFKSKKEVRDMAKNYIKQAGKILDMDKAEIRYNSEWYDKMTAQDLLKLMGHVTERRMIERDMFQERIKKGLDIRLHEIVYPLLQGYDSVMLKSDLTVCGNDQIFNELIGRHLQVQFGQPPQDIIAMRILTGTDGKQKMSQSLGNYIGIMESADEQYGKIMSVSDELIVQYFTLITRIPMKEITAMEEKLKQGAMNPRDAKAKLAFEVAALYHGTKEARKAEQEFIRRFKKRQLPSEITKISIPRNKINILDLLIQSGLASSKAEAKRLVEQGGVKIQNIAERDWKKIIQIEQGMIIQVGKRNFRQIS